MKGTQLQLRSRCAGALGVSGKITLFGKGLHVCTKIHLPA